MRLFFVGALTLLAIAMAAPVAGAADLPAATYVHAGKLLDVRSGKMLSDQLIVIRGDRIERILPSGGVQIPAGATTVDLTHATVLPGLIDCHTHIMLTDTDNSHYDDILLKQSWQYRTILATLNVKRDLEAGFTTMRDVETEGAMYSDVDVRNAINQGLIPGPRLKVATRGISTTGGYGLEGYSPEVTVPVGVETIDSPSEARKAVREQFNYGADLIKIYGTDRYSFLPDGKEVSIADFSLEEVQAIVDEARLKGLKVACHAYDGPGLHYCIDAGVASIEHGIQLDDDAIRKMVAKGIYLVPTLYVYCCALEKGDLADVWWKDKPARHPRGQFQEGPGGGSENSIWHRRWLFSARHPGDRVRVDDAIRHVASAGNSSRNYQRCRLDGVGRSGWRNRGGQIC